MLRRVDRGLQIGNRRLKIENLFTPWCNGNTAPFGGVILGSNPSGAATSKASPRIYRPGVGLEIGNANVAEGDASGEPEGEVDVGDGETVGVGDGVGVGGGGIIFSQ